MYIYDIETYPNIFTLSCLRDEDDAEWFFEISERRNDISELMGFLTALQNCDARMVGYNNLGFDYPVIHMIMESGGSIGVSDIYNKAMSIIKSPRGDWSHFINEKNRYIKQVDLYKIHHFDNAARSTSLKTLEFNMRSPNIQDLPFTPGT